MKIVEIATGDARYQDELDLRHRVLRAPLGMARGAFPGEERCRHWVALEESGALLGCVLLQPDGPRRGKLRQMAVAPERHGEGIGRALVLHLEAEALRAGLAEIVMHARATAVGFYERLGYAAAGDEFLEVGIPHRHMAKRL
jgi:predicted GNAT family N-acyltransferase